MDSSFDTNRTVAVILARGGSKGVPRKNVRELGGIPLVGRAIETLRQVEAIQRVVVSTDCPEVASLALAYGADVPFMRPPALARDDTPSLKALEHAVQALRRDGDDAGVTLLYQATSPCCRPEQVDRALALFHSSGASYLKSVTPVEEHPHWMGFIDGGRFHFLYPPETRALRRQDLPTIHRLNGAISVYWTSRILDRAAEAGEPVPFVMDRESSIDIDSVRDWERAERVLA
ncbi:MAG: NTP transferase domain-containing protein [Planctomycetota bacterium]